MKYVNYGKLRATSYCPHGFSRRTARGVPVICGFCDPEAYDKRVKESGRKYTHGGASNKRILAY